METTKQTAPKLSIVMPFFNHPELVSEMIESLLANDFKEWELLAIDDGSDQTAIDALMHYTADERICMLHRDRLPKGAQTCRNIGLEKATGKYIVFFDSDDYVAPYCLKNRVEQLEQHPELDFMVFRSGVYLDGNFITQPHDRTYGYPIYKDDLKAFIRRTLPFIVWSNIYRTEALRQNQLVWDIHLLSFQDSDYNIQALLHGMKYAYSDTAADYGYRIEGNTGSISKKTVSEEHRNSHLYFLRRQFEQVQSVHGHHYDHALYQCALNIFSSLMPDGIDYVYAQQLADIVAQHSKRYGWRFKLQLHMSRLLQKVVSPRMARQIPTAIYLIKKRHWENTIARKVARIQQQ